MSAPKYSELTVREKLPYPCRFFSLGKRCRKEHPQEGFICTRRNGHNGAHIAHASQHYRCAVWNDEEEQP